MAYFEYTGNHDNTVTAKHQCGCVRWRETGNAEWRWSFLCAIHEPVYFGELGYPLPGNHYDTTVDHQGNRCPVHGIVWVRNDSDTGAACPKCSLGECRSYLKPQGRKVTDEKLCVYCGDPIHDHSWMAIGEKRYHHGCKRRMWMDEQLKPTFKPLPDRLGATAARDTKAGQIGGLRAGDVVVHSTGAGNIYLPNSSGDRVVVGDDREVLHSGIKFGKREWEREFIGTFDHPARGDDSHTCPCGYRSCSPDNPTMDSCAERYGKPKALAERAREYMRLYFGDTQQLTNDNPTTRDSLINSLLTGTPPHQDCDCYVCGLARNPGWLEHEAASRIDYGGESCRLLAYGLNAWYCGGRTERDG